MTVTLDISAIIAGAGAALTTASVAWAFVIRPLRATMRRLALFSEDWEGEHARPGVPGRDGVMVRLANIEASQAAHLTSHNAMIVTGSFGVSDDGRKASA